MLKKVWRDNFRIQLVRLSIILIAKQKCQWMKASAYYFYSPAVNLLKSGIIEIYLYFFELK